MSTSRPGRVWTPEAPHLMLTRTRYGEIAAPEMGVAGVIRLRAKGPDRRVRREQTFRNLITDAALTAAAMGTSFGSLSAYAAVGTGTQAPAVGDTALQAQGPARTSTSATGDGSIGNGSNTPPYWNWYRVARKWGVGAATGTWTEIGFFSAATGGIMLNRQLMQDASGVPTPFTVLPDEELWADLFLRVYVPPGDAQGEVAITGSGTHPYTMRPMNAIQPNPGSYGGGWHPAQAVPSIGSTYYNNGLRETNVLAAATGSASVADYSVDCSLAAHSPGTVYRDLAMTADPAKSNFVTGIGGGNVGGRFQFAFPSAKIMKTASQRLVLNFRFPFGRYTGPL